MVVDESGLAGLLKKEYKHGYDIVMDADRVVLMGEGWLVEAPRETLPRKVLGTIVEHMGVLPESDAAMTVCKDMENQGIMPEVAWGSVQERKEARHGAEAVILPLVWAGLQLYQRTDARVVGVSTDFLRVLDRPTPPPIILDGDRAVWSADGQIVVFTGYHPYSGLEADRWAAVEAMDWSKKGD